MTIFDIYVDKIKETSVSFGTIAKEETFQLLNPDSRKLLENICAIYNFCDAMYNLYNLEGISKDEIDVIAKSYLNEAIKNTSIEHHAFLKNVYSFYDNSNTRLTNYEKYSRVNAYLNNGIKHASNKHKTLLDIYIDKVKSSPKAFNTIKHDNNFTSLHPTYKDLIGNLDSLYNKLGDLTIADKDSLAKDYMLNAIESVSKEATNPLYSLPYHSLVKDHALYTTNQQDKVWLEDVDINELYNCVLNKVNPKAYSNIRLAHNGFDKVSTDAVNDQRRNGINPPLPLYYLLNEFKKQGKDNKLSIALHRGGNHWVALTLIPDLNNRQKAYVIYRDSLNLEIPDEISKTIKRFYEKSEILKSDKILQNDGHSCGVFTTLNLLGDSMLYNATVRNIFNQPSSAEEKLNKLNKEVSLREQFLLKQNKTPQPDHIAQPRPHRLNYSNRCREQSRSYGLPNILNSNIKPLRYMGMAR